MLRQPKHENEINFVPNYESTKMKQPLRLCEEGLILI